jgi:hypothetical protein
MSNIGEALPIWEQDAVFSEEEARLGVLHNLGTLVGERLAPERRSILAGHSGITAAERLLKKHEKPPDGK